MTPQAFARWLAEMISAGEARSAKDCADLLGMSAEHVSRMKRRGAPRYVALACRALLHRLEPYK